MIELVDIGFAFDQTPVLSKIDLTVGDGELVMVVGPNGAGKSTLLRIIGGLLEPSSGCARVGGIDPRKTPRHKLARMLAFLPQSYQVTFPFSVLELVLMGRYVHERRGLFGFDSDDALQRARTSMQQCGVDHLAERRIDKLSGGEMRRVQIAQALCQNASLLLLDEPTAALDPAHAVAVMSALADGCRGQRSAVVVTHDLNLAGRFAHRMLLLDSGRLRRDGAPREVLHSAELGEVFGVSMFTGTLPAQGTPFVVPQ